MQLNEAIKIEKKINNSKFLKKNQNCFRERDCDKKNLDSLKKKKAKRD